MQLHCLTFYYLIFPIFHQLHLLPKTLRLLSECVLHETLAHARGHGAHRADSLGSYSAGNAAKTLYILTRIHRKVLLILHGRPSMISISGGSIVLVLIHHIGIVLVLKSFRNGTFHILIRILAGPILISFSSPHDLHCYHHDHL